MTQNRIRGYKRTIARTLYTRTRAMPCFSTNDFRGHQLHKLPIFKNPQTIGGFFRDLKIEGYIEQAGHTRAAHEAAKGREIKLWKWTAKAASMLAS